jgi:flagellar basal body-associated protein FliL
VSRLKSLLAAAKLAQRAAKEAKQRRREKRNTWLMIIGLAMVSISLMVGDYFWLKARAQKRREQHMQSRHRPAQTNSPAAPVSISERQSVSALTNHE